MGDMTNIKNDESCCSPANKGIGCCKVEALVGIDERGQMVLPKETREKAGIKAGDKLAIISCEKNGKTCCLTMIKADELTGMVKDMLGPMLGDLLK
jgi:antitoxin PrlF